MSAAPEYTIKVEGDIIRVTIKGNVTADILTASTDESRKTAEKAGIKLMFCDLKSLDKASLTIPIQAKSIGILWGMRHYDKAAFLVTDKEILELLNSSLNTVGMTEKFQPFDDQAKAIAWLKS